MRSVFAPLDQPQVPHPWQSLWQAYRSPAASPAYRSDILDVDGTEEITANAGDPAISCGQEDRLRLHLDSLYPQPGSADMPPITWWWGGTGESNQHPTALGLGDPACGQGHRKSLMVHHLPRRARHTRHAASSRLPAACRRRVPAGARSDRGLRHRSGRNRRRGRAQLFTLVLGTVWLRPTQCAAPRPTRSLPR